MEKIEEVINDIKELCNNAKITDPTNLFHVLVAYLRDNEIKTEEDYAINAVVSSLIYETINQIKEDEIKVNKKELGILCRAIMIADDEEEEIIIDEKKDEVNI